MDTAAFAVGVEAEAFLVIGDEAEQAAGTSQCAWSAELGFIYFTQRRRGVEEFGGAFSAPLRLCVKHWVACG